MYLYTPGVTCFIKLFPNALNVGYHNGDVLVAVVVAVVSVCRIVVVVEILVMFLVEFVL